MENKKKIFIPFIDGMLNYDCQECNALCCKQNGYIIMNAKDKKMLLQKYPSLRYFFVKETKKLYWIFRYSECWFLESDGLCYIQKKYGYSSKPFICGVAPFYVVKYADEYVVITKECPKLCVDKGNKNTSHKRIFKDAQETIDNDNVLEEISWSGRRLNLEKEILESSKMFLDRSSYLDFSAYQIAITKNEDMGKIKSELLESVELWKSFLEIDELNMENKRLTYELTAITSLLRTGSFELSLMEAKKVPAALLALYFYMILFSKTRKAKTYVEIYKEILCNISLGLLYLKKDDLNIKSRSIEAKLNHLHLLQKLYIRKLMRKAKKVERKYD